MYILLNPWFTDRTFAYPGYSTLTTTEEAVMDIVRTYLYSPTYYETYTFTVYNTIGNSYHSYTLNIDERSDVQFSVRPITMSTDTDLTWFNELRLHFLSQNFNVLNTPVYFKNSLYKFLSLARSVDVVPDHVINGLATIKMPVSDNIEMNLVSYKDKHIPTHISNKKYNGVKFAVL